MAAMLTLKSVDVLVKAAFSLSRREVASAMAVFAEALSFWLVFTSSLVWARRAEDWSIAAASCGSFASASAIVLERSPPDVVQ